MDGVARGMMGGGRPERNCDNQIYCLNTCQLISFVLIGMLPIFFFSPQIFVNIFLCEMNGENIERAIVMRPFRSNT